jgi:CRP-like cAMP-binding protein
LIGYAERRVPPDLLTGPATAQPTSMSLDETIKALDDETKPTKQPAQDSAKNQAPISRRTVAPNSVIFEEGDSAACAYLLKSGKVEISKNQSGQSVLLTTILPNQIFGELALIDGSPRSATAIATETCEVVFVKPEDIERRLDGADEFIKYWITYLTGRVRDLSKRVEG